MNLFSHCLLFFIIINAVFKNENAPKLVEGGRIDEFALKTMYRGANLFSNNLFQQLTHENHGNVVCSPLSIRIILSMAFHGSAGDTLQQLKSVLKLPTFEVTLQHGVRALLESLKNSEGIELKIANKILVKKNANLISKYSNILTEYYQSTVDAVDFSNPHQVAENINSWVDAQTNHQIQGVVNPDDLGADVSMILVNAVYFHGVWAKKFKKESTHDADFHIDNDQLIKVKTMTTTGFFNYGEIPQIEAKYIELPYECDRRNESISMFIIVPQQAKNLENMINNLHTINLSELTKKATKVELYLPKFKIESKLNMIQPLITMGIDRAFADTAEFPHILENENLKINNIIQKTFLAVDEDGTEASSATEMEFSDRFGFDDDNVPIFRVDSRFISVIIDKKTQTQLFVAQVINPNEE